VLCLVVQTQWCTLSPNVVVAATGAQYRRQGQRGPHLPTLPACLPPCLSVSPSLAPCLPPSLPLSWFCFSAFTLPALIPLPCYQHRPACPSFHPSVSKPISCAPPLTSPAVEDEAFWKDIMPLELGDLPALQEAVAVVG
jgi:hypothetical protein